MQTNYMASPSLSTIHGHITQSQATAINSSDDFEDKQRQEKHLFDMKMKIFNLEDNLKQQQEQGQTREAFHERAKAELGDLKLQLEEKEIELEQRNLLLLKAKSAIETLKNEIDRLRSTEIQQGHVEEQLTKLKQMNENVEQDYKLQIQLLQNELQKIKQSLVLKEKENTILDDQIVSVFSLPQNYHISNQSFK